MKRPSLYYSHQKAGARFADCQGWEMPASFTSPATEVMQVRQHAGVADLSYRAKFDTRIEPSQPFWKLGKDHYLIVGEPPVAAPAAATEVTSVFAELLLTGPDSFGVLAKLTSLNVSKLANLACAQASVAHVHTIVLREDIGAFPAFHLLMSREYAEAAWEAILHAGHEFHLQPFGLEALQQL
jgi:glycine cleavage system aminomethyltransferase T